MEWHDFLLSTMTTFEEDLQLCLTSNYDAAKNRIYIKLEGMMGMDEAKDYDNTTRQHVDKAKEGYTFCIDMADAQPLRPK